MSVTNSGSASAFPIASSNQNSHANPYGDPRQNNRLAVKAPIQEKLNNSLESVAWWTWRITLGSMLVACVGSLWLMQSGTPVTGKDATASSLTIFVFNIVACTFAGIGLICAPIFAVVVRKQTKQIKQIKAGHYLARWDLDKEQWNSYIKEEKEKAKESVSTATIVCVVLGLILWFPLSGFLDVMTCILAIVGMGILGFVMGTVIAAIRKHRLNRMIDTPRFTIIGHDGLYFQNGYYAYSTFGSGLSNIEKVKTGLMEYLVFTFVHQTNNGQTEIERRVPVPRGRNDEAAWILKHLA